MDELLTDRYRALFAGYGVGADQLVLDSIKGYIASRVDIYREDAMYFLLVNMDHMVVRALSGYVPGPSPLGFGMPWKIHPNDMASKISECFKLIEGSLDMPQDLKADAHAVMRAINANQKPLDLLLWWKG